MEWETIIGLEVHAQLATRSKIFSGASTTYGAEPNTQASAIDLGLPGILPVLNGEVVRMAVKFGLSINATINKRSVFDRKNYFYPDLPKGYQISQFFHPIVKDGYLDISLEEGNTKRIGILRAHLEEDAGKSVHEDFHGMTGLDFNRAGTPLLEIVSHPDMRSAKEAVAYLKVLHALVRYLEICDGNMQEGSFRCDANVSVRLKGQTILGTRAEIKNLNSFRFIEKAINYEVKRQIDILESGGKIIQETRLYDSEKNETRSLRTKEDATDYRYFPDPDLLPIELDDSYIAQVKAELPELPTQKRQRFQAQYHLSEYDANILVSSREIANYFELAIQHTDAPAKWIANWIMGDLLAALNKANLDIIASPISALHLAKLIQRIHDQTISGKIAKTIFETMWEEGSDPDEIIQKQDLKQMTDNQAIEDIIAKIIARFPEQASEYRAGKTKLFGFFIGQVMKATEGKINPQQLNEVLQKKLS